MKSRLIILSDLWGKAKANWIPYYEKGLSEKFDIVYYDCCELGEIDSTDYTQDRLHAQFVGGGIDKAVENLLKLEPNPVNILAFSIGGTIAWKAGLGGLQVQSLFAVSATRLRYETLKPASEIRLFFGQLDAFQPNVDWYEKHRLSAEISKGKTHQMYMEEEYARFVCEELKEKVQ